VPGGGRRDKLGQDKWRTGWGAGRRRADGAGERSRGPREQEAVRAAGVIRIGRLQ